MSSLFRKIGNIIRIERKLLSLIIVDLWKTSSTSLTWPDNRIEPIEREMTSWISYQLSMKYKIFKTKEELQIIWLTVLVPAYWPLRFTGIGIIQIFKKGILEGQFSWRLFSAITLENNLEYWLIRSNLFKTYLLIFHKKICFLSY